MNQESNPSRRAVLGTFAAAPAFVAIPASPVRASTPRDWDQAVADYHSAVAAVDRFHDEHHEPASERYFTIRDKWPMSHDWKADPIARPEIEAAMALFTPIEERFSDLVGEHAKAADALVALPAPNLEALALKVKIALIETEDCEFPDEYRSSLVADARRLGGC